MACACSHSAHLVPPAYALPPKGFDDATYSPEVRGWSREYEKKYGEKQNLLCKQGL